MELYLPDQDGAGLRAGLYDDRDTLVHDATRWSGRVPAVFVSLNVLGGRAGESITNRLHSLRRPPRDRTNASVLRRRWLPIDLDPRRPPNTNSTEQEHEAALATAVRVRAWLADCGWPAPILADSGNGAHLLYRIDLPADAASTRLVELGLAALSLRFSDRRVWLDASVGDAERLWKLYGTLAAKGPPTAERPHRLARMLKVPAQLKTVTPDLIAALPRSPMPGR